MRPWFYLLILYVAMFVALLVVTALRSSSDVLLYMLPVRHFVVALAGGALVGVIFGAVGTAILRVSVGLVVCLFAIGGAGAFWIVGMVTSGFISSHIARAFLPIMASDPFSALLGAIGAVAAVAYYLERALENQQEEHRL